MRTIAVASSKGGVGKTTIACCLAWRASLESGPVAAIDLNRDQGNFEQWAGLRDKPLKGIELIKDYGDLKTEKRTQPGGPVRQLPGTSCCSDRRPNAALAPSGQDLTPATANPGIAPAKKKRGARGGPSHREMDRSNRGKSD